MCVLTENTLCGVVHVVRGYARPPYIFYHLYSYQHILLEYSVCSATHRTGNIGCTVHKSMVWQTVLGNSGQANRSAHPSFDKESMSPGHSRLETGEQKQVSANPWIARARQAFLSLCHP